jgi:hypothetical protein
VTRDEALALLADVAAGRVDAATALDRLAFAPPSDLGFATLDLDRVVRHGYPEVVFGSGKTAAQVVAIAEALWEAHGRCLVTRADAEVRAALQARFPEAAVEPLGRTVQVGTALPARGGPPLAIVTAGTADLPVADEAAATARFLGLPRVRVTDVGVAGVHRVLAARATLASAGAVIVVAGMDGALPSVIGGLVACPVIAVPTSVGYGAAFAGLAPLLTMLNSCAAGVVVTNIDNGFGAAVAAARALR